MTELAPAAGPLDGVRIIAVEQYGAGPFATLYLADMGADVIKIEDPSVGGDVGRYVPPGQRGADSLFFETFNRGKRSVALDLKNTAGREVLERLVARADVVFNNLRGDLPDALGLTYEALGHINPAVVCASLSGYGRSGPRRTHPGYDALIQAEAGWAALTGDPDGPPVKSGLSLVDYAGGLIAALGIMVALHQARRTGRGANVDTSLYDAALALLTYPATWHLSAGLGTARLPQSAHPSIVPFQFFETSDGHLAIACAKEKFFRALAEAIGLPGLVDDPRFASFAARRVNRDALVAILGERLRQDTTSAWLERLRGSVPVAPVRAMADALTEAELAGRGLLVDYDHPQLGTVRGIGAPFAVGDYRPAYRAGPALDGDRESLLAWLGFGAEEMQRLARDGAFGARGQTDAAVRRAARPTGAADDDG
jgi:crotonobetainyl-CoA:carnitine CoA-transferase CaiB-like acyl-CoA transferase